MNIELVNERFSNFDNAFNADWHNSKVAISFCFGGDSVLSVVDFFVWTGIKQIIQIGGFDMQVKILKSLNPVNRGSERLTLQISVQ